MNVRVVCPQGHALAAPAKLAGTRVQCPVCHTAFTIPSPDHSPAPAPATDPFADLLSPQEQARLKSQVNPLANSRATATPTAAGQRDQAVLNSYLAQSRHDLGLSQQCELPSGNWQAVRGGMRCLSVGGYLLAGASVVGLEVIGFVTFVANTGVGVAASTTVLGALMGLHLLWMLKDSSEFVQDRMFALLGANLFLLVLPLTLFPPFAALVLAVVAAAGFVSVIGAVLGLIGFGMSLAAPWAGGLRGSALLALVFAVAAAVVPVSAIAQGNWLPGQAAGPKVPLVLLVYAEFGFRALATASFLAFLYFLRQIAVLANETDHVSEILVTGVFSIAAIVFWLMGFLVDSKEVLVSSLLALAGFTTSVVQTFGFARMATVTHDLITAHEP